MKPHEIEAGKVYINRGRGRTKRRVIAIGPEHVPREWLGKERTRPPADEPGVLYEQIGEGTRHNLFLTSFAAWAGRAIR